MAPSYKTLERATQTLNEARKEKAAEIEHRLNALYATAELMGINVGPRPPRPSPVPPLPPLPEPPRLVREDHIPKKPRPHFRVIRRPGGTRPGHYHWIVQRRVLWFFWSAVTSYFDDRAGAVRRMNDLQRSRDEGKAPRVVIYPDPPESRIETPMDGRLSLVPEEEE